MHSTHTLFDSCVLCSVCLCHGRRVQKQWTPLTHTHAACRNLYFVRVALRRFSTFWRTTYFRVDFFLLLGFYCFLSKVLCVAAAKSWCPMMSVARCVRNAKQAIIWIMMEFYHFYNVPDCRKLYMRNAQHLFSFYDSLFANLMLCLRWVYMRKSYLDGINPLIRGFYILFVYLITGWGHSLCLFGFKDNAPHGWRKGLCNPEIITESRQFIRNPLALNDKARRDQWFIFLRISRTLTATGEKKFPTRHFSMDIVHIDV